MDRIFDQSYIKELCSELRSTMSDMKSQLETMEDVAVAAINVMNSVPSDVVDYSVFNAAQMLKNNVSNIDISSFLTKIEECEVRTTSLIPTVDEHYCEQINELITIINNTKEAVAEVAEFLKNTPLTMSNKEFTVAYNDMQEKCNKCLNGAILNIEQILENVKGAEKISVIFSEDPVNLSTGNFIYDRTDLEIGGAHPFKFSRFYNSINHRKGALGRDWNHNYEVRIFKEDNELVLFREEGKEERFFKTSTGEYTAVYHSSGSLSETEEGYQYRTREQVTYYFDKEGCFLRQETGEGVVTELSYEEKEGEKRLTGVERSTGEFFALSYDDAGYLSSVTDHAGRTITYRMEGELLQEVSTPMGHRMSYEYTAEGKLKGVTNPRGIKTVENEFDEKMRTTLQRFPDGGQMSYEYDDEKREVILTERNGSKITYVHDRYYRDIRHVYADGEERFEYNKLNQKTLVVDKLGNRTQFGYDSKGNLTRVINALGIKTEIQYNEKNQPTYIAIDGKEKVRNRYDGEGNLVETRDPLGNLYRIEYAGKGRPEKLLQPDGSEISIQYDNRGNIVCLTDPVGNSSRFVYDNLNRVVETTDGNGNVTKFSYDTGDNLIKVMNAAGREKTYEYNENGKVTKITDFDGSCESREYNVLNKPSKITDKQGRKTLLTYDVMWNLARITEADGSRTTYLYDENNRLGRIRNANGDVVRYTYDANGNRTGVEDEEGNKTQFTYDAIGRLVSVVEADGSIISYKYNAEGEVTEVTDALGNRVTMEYDAAGQLIKETNQAGESRSYTYTCLGNVESITDEAGLVTKHVYEPGGQLRETIYPDGSKESYAYDANGNRTALTDRRGYCTTYIYDCLDRIIEMKGSDGAGKFYEYDCMGNVTSITDVQGNRTTYEYSLTGQLTKVTDALGNRTEYQYDTKDQLVEIRQYGEPAGEDKTGDCRITKYERNLMGRITKVTDPLGQSESYTYNKRGELVEKLDKEGYLTRYGYTVKGDVSHIRYADGREVRLSYNPLRQLQEIEDWLGITRVENDAMGRAVKVTGPDGKEVSYTYDKAGRRSGIIYPDGTAVSYAYDALGRLQSLTQGGKTINYGYDEAGYLNRKTYPNGMETIYGYTEKGQIESLIHSDIAGILDRYAYTYDSMGNKTGIEKERRGLEKENGRYAYAYDALGRLERVSKDGRELRSYTYDAFGNRTGVTGESGVIRYAYNALNQLVSKTDAQNETTYRYDRRGNLSLVLENSHMKNAYVYGAMNRLEEARNAQGDVSRYIYNGVGRRVGKETGVLSAESMTPETYENGLDPVKKLESTSFIPTSKVDYVLDLTREYHNLLQKCEDSVVQTYLWDGNVAGMLEEGSSRESYYLQDELGSPIRLVDGEGSLQDSYGYDEFGQDLYGNQGVIQPFGYTGYQHDHVSGTYFAQAREYRAGEGRFGGEDLIKGNILEPISLNAYIYCKNDSLGYVDLNGKFAVPALLITIVIGVVVGAGVGAVSEVAVQGIDCLRGKQDSINWAKVAGASVEGAIVGGVSVIPGVNIVGKVVAGGIGGAANSAVSQKIEYGSVNYRKVAEDALVGAVTSGIFEGISEGVSSLTKKIRGKEVSSSAGETVGDMLYNPIKSLWDNTKKIITITLVKKTPSGLTRRTEKQLIKEVWDVTLNYIKDELKDKFLSIVTGKNLAEETTKNILTWFSPIYNEGNISLKYLNIYFEGMLNDSVEVCL